MAKSSNRNCEEITQLKDNELTIHHKLSSQHKFEHFHLKKTAVIVLKQVCVYHSMKLVAFILTCANLSSVQFHLGSLMY